MAMARSCPGSTPERTISTTGTSSRRTSKPDGSIVSVVPAACQAARTGSRSATGQYEAVPFFRVAVIAAPDDGRSVR